MKSDEYLPLVRWGTYKDYSGPFTLGKHRYTIPENPTFWDKTLATLTATEGGRYGAVNMYDRCIVSVGLVQWCEAATIYAVSRMLAECADADLDLLQSYLAEMPVSCGFRRGGGDQWRFHLRGQQVASKAEQREIFLGGATGYKGQWTEDQKEHAKRVAAVMSAMWQEPLFRKTQDKFTHERLLAFAMPKSRKILFPDDGYSTKGPAGALRAAFLSFAGNLPAVADEQFRKVSGTFAYQQASIDDQLVMALRQMTFGPGIAIYPHRYEAIRPVLEREFGVELPDFADELAEFQELIPEVALFPDMASIQRELVKLEYDLGPAGADGVMGAKTIAAIRQFETDHELPYPDGMPDAAFLKKLAQVVTEEEDDKPEPPAIEPEPDDEPLHTPEERVPEVKPIESVQAKDSDKPEEPEGSGSSKWTIGLIAFLAALAAAVGKACGWY